MGLIDCPFDILFFNNIPHILTSIFLSLRTQEFERCRLVCKTWKNFIDIEILDKPHLAKIVSKKRVVTLWKEEQFAEISLDLKKSGINWSKVSIEAVSVKEKDIYLASQVMLYHFHNFKFVQMAKLPENDKMKRMFVSSKLIFIVSKFGYRGLVYNRLSLNLVHYFKCEQKMNFKYGSKLNFDDSIIEDVDGTFYLLQKDDGYDSITIFMIDNNSGKLEVLWKRTVGSLMEEILAKENCLRAFDSREEVEGSMRFQLSESFLGINPDFVLAVHENGYFHLLTKGDGQTAITKRYSTNERNFVKRIFISQEYFGMVYIKRHHAEKCDCDTSYKVMDVRTTDILVQRDDLASYGRSYFSVSTKHFVFSYADANHNQHFIIHKKDFPVWKTKEFILTDRFHPMRSLQILKDKLLILSSYRTASALSLFDLDILTTDSSLKRMSDAENIKKLRAGVIAFQSSYYSGNGQDLVLYNDTGILCQTLNFSCENVVFSLKFSAQASNLPETEKKKAHQTSGALESFAHRLIRFKRN